MSERNTGNGVNGGQELVTYNCSQHYACLIRLFQIKRFVKALLLEDQQRIQGGPRGLKTLLGHGGGRVLDSCVRGKYYRKGQRI